MLFFSKVLLMRAAYQEASRTTVLEKALLPRVLYVLNVYPADKFGSMEEQIVFLARAFEEAGSRFVPLFTFEPAPGILDSWHEQGIDAQCLDLLRFSPRTFVKLCA